MTAYILKILISVVIIVAVTELSKRGSIFWGGLLASLPLTSLIAFGWLYFETGDAVRIAALSWSILWLIIPSLVLFIALPLLLRHAFAFGSAVAISLLLMTGAYLLAAIIARRFGIAI